MRARTSSRSDGSVPAATRNATCRTPGLPSTCARTNRVRRVISSLGHTRRAETAKRMRGGVHRKNVRLRALRKQQPEMPTGWGRISRGNDSPVLVRTSLRTLTLLLVVLGCGASQNLAQTKKPVPATPQFGHWGPSGYHLIRKIPIPGNDAAGRLAFNTIRRRVFFAYGTHVLVINPYLGKIVGDIRGLQGARDVVFASELQRGFVTEQTKNDVVIFDPLTQKIIGRAPTAAGPDSVTYDPATKRVFTMN